MVLHNYISKYGVWHYFIEKDATRTICGKEMGENFYPKRKALIGKRARCKRCQRQGQVLLRSGSKHFKGGKRT